NNRPRKTLKFRTPNEVITKYLQRVSKNSLLRQQLCCRVSSFNPGETPQIYDLKIVVLGYNSGIRMCLYDINICNCKNKLYLYNNNINIFTINKLFEMF
ncbi:MAG: hypothetical protein ACK5WP_09700, partial [Neisseriaceae bacterium]